MRPERSINEPQALGRVNPQIQFCRGYRGSAKRTPNGEIKKGQIENPIRPFQKLVFPSAKLRKHQRTQLRLRLFGEIREDHRDVVTCVLAAGAGNYDAGAMEAPLW